MEQSPAVSMRYPHKRVRPKTYSIGLYLVVLVLFFQVIAVLSVFWLRRAVQIDMESPRLRVPSALALPLPAPDKPRSEPEDSTSHPTDSAVSSITPQASPTPSPAIPDSSNSPATKTPTNQVLQPESSGRLALAATLDPATRLASLNQEAERFEKEGDFDLARAALLEAESLSPTHPLTLRNSALLAELQSDRSRALVYWQRLIGMGSIAVPASIYQEAMEHGEKLSDKATNPLEPAKDPVLFGAGVLEQTTVMESDTVTEFNLKIPIILLQIDRPVQLTDIAIKLFFYDKLPSGEIVPTVASRKTTWVGHSPDWSKQTTETLAATYRLNKTPSGPRFYGYLFRIYYKGKLQDEKGQPAKITRMFPSAPVLNVQP